MQTLDQELLERWYAEGDAGAFREITSRYANLVFAAARRVLGDAVAAEDVAQECFEALALKPGARPAYLGAWLHTAATNRALTVLDASRRRRARELRAAESAPDATRAHWDDIYEHVDAAIAELPEEYRAAVVGHFLEGQGKAELARALGVSRPTIHYRIDKGLEQARHALRQRGVTASAGVLTAAMVAQASEAAPASLVAALGKIAISSVSAVTSGGLIAWSPTAISVVLMNKLWVVGVAALAFAAGIGAVLYSQRPLPSPGEGAPPVLPVAREEAAPEESLAEATMEEPVESSERTANVGSAKAMAPDLEDPAIAGVVVDPQGNPIAGAELHVEPIPVEAVPYPGGPDGVPGKEKASDTILVTSDVEGKFKLGGLVAGTYAGYASHPEFSLASFQIEAGDELARIEMEARSVIRGVVVDEGSGAPVSDFDVVLQSSGVPIIRSEFLPEGVPVQHAQGEFELPAVMIGDWGVVVHAKGYVPAITPVSIEQGGSEQHIQVALRPGAVVEGYVKTISGTPVAGAWVFAKPPVSASQLARQAEADVKSLSKKYAKLSLATTDGTGFFRIDTLVGNERSLFALHPARGGGMTDIGAGDLNAGGRMEIIVQRARCDAIAIVTADGIPLAGLTVEAAPEGGIGARFAGATTDVDGRALLQGLPAGAVVFRTSLTGEGGSARQLVVESTMREGLRVEVLMEFAPAESAIDVAVINGERKLKNGIVVLVVQSGTSTERYFGKMGSDIQLTMGNIVAGEATVSFQGMLGRLHMQRTIALSLLPGETHAVEIDLTVVGGVQGNVTGVPEGYESLVGVFERGTRIRVVEAEDLSFIIERNLGKSLINRDGSYHVEDIAAGERMLFFVAFALKRDGSMEDIRIFSTDVDVPVGDTVVVDADLN